MSTDRSFTEVPALLGNGLLRLSQAEQAIVAELVEGFVDALAREGLDVAELELELARVRRCDRGDAGRANRRESIPAPRRRAGGSSPEQGRTAGRFEQLRTAA
jgi:hypothetical protein